MIVAVTVIGMNVGALALSMLACVSLNYLERRRLARSDPVRPRL